MSDRLECDGSVFCQIADHVVVTPTRGGRRFTHIRLTAAQKNDIRVRREQATFADSGNREAAPYE